jgi:uncharacterized protein YggE
LKKNVFYTMLLILGLVSLYACERETIVMSDENLNQIRVVGSASITTSPDIATVQIGVQTFNSELEAAIDENNRKSEAIQTALRQQGVEEKDIKTSSFNVYPQRDYQNNKPDVIVGYQVDNTVSAVIRDLDSVGKTLQAAIDAGANNIYGISFSLDDPRPFEDEARVKAIEDAREKAESMAEAAGIKLGKVLSINEISGSSPAVARAEYDEAVYKAEVPIQPGELELTMSVEVVFEIP